MSTINLKFFRSFFNLTQKKLANHLSIEEQTIKYYESGHTIPSFKILIKIQTLFQISVDFLVFNEKCYYPKNLKLLKLAKKLDNFYKSEARNNIEATTKNLLGEKINATCKTKQDTININLIDNFNLNLKNIRIHKNVTQSEIGKAINSARSTVSLYEKNSYPKLKKMIKLSEFLNISIHAIKLWAVWRLTIGT